MIMTMMMMMMMMMMMIIVLLILNLKDYNLLYNKKINIPVCVISLSSVIKKEDIHYPILRLQKCSYENENF